MEMCASREDNTMRTIGQRSSVTFHCISFIKTRVLFQYVIYHETNLT